MKQLKGVVILFLIGIYLVTACSGPNGTALGYDSQPAHFAADLSRLDPFTFELARHEPFKGPFLAEFQQGSRHLYYLAARHANSTSSATFRLVSQSFAKFPIDVVVLEGFPRAAGISPKSIVRLFREQRDGCFYKHGEPAFAAILASERNFPFVGAEPTDRDICRQLLAKGYSSEDIMGFYFARQVPEYKRDRTLASKSIRQAFAEFVSANKPEMGLNDLDFGYKKFMHWYRKRNRASFNVESLRNDDVAPIAGGKLFTQQISADVGLIRDAYILQTIASVLDSYKHVLVVYGASHLATQRRVLEAMLGKPVRQSSNLSLQKRGTQ